MHARGIDGRRAGLEGYLPAVALASVRAGAAALADRRRFLTRALARVAEGGRAIVLLPLYFLSGLVRRRRNDVAFGGNGDRFTDNARHLFLHLASDPRFRCTWISGDAGTVDAVRALGLRAERRWSLAGVRTALRAGWFVFGAYPSDVNFWLSRGARHLNLWHGIPLKAIEFDITAGPLARLYRSPVWSPLRLAFLDRFRRPDHLLTVSPFLAERCFRPAFRIGAGQSLELGYPRTDPLFDVTDRAALAARLGVDPAHEVIGYFPTWREDGRDFLAAAGFSFDELDARLRPTGRTLLFKAHPNFAIPTASATRWTNVVVVDPSVDLNDLLPVCDVLVTDYSSVAFDFLLLDRPIVYFLPDHDRYVTGRNLYFELDEMTAGPIVTTPTALAEILTGSLADEHAARRAELRERVWGDYRGDASGAIADFMAAR
jgi:CDP-glycerol glycerophosphotransferase (TagB/SpsB family)